MKLRFIGTGSFGSRTRALTSMLINDEILFDAGGGTVRGLQNYGTDISKIKCVIITHFHVDHLLDLPNFIVQRYVQKVESPLNIIGPPDLKLAMSGGLDFCMGESKKYLDNTKFIELVDDKVSLGEYDILSRRVVHDPVRDYVTLGYEIVSDTFRFGFSGDATKCVGLDNIVANSDNLFLDATMPSGADDRHLNFGGVLEYANQYPNKKFYMVHRGEYEVGDLPKNVFAPNDGDVINL